MKKYITIFFTLIFFLNIQGQTLVKENKLWTNTELGTEMGSIYRSYYIKFQDDTIINELTYKKIWRCNDSLQNIWFVDGYIREDTAKKVFIYNKQLISEELIFDFNLEIGDSINVPNIPNTYIHVDSIYYLHHLNSSDSSRVMDFTQFSSWIEGIGSFGGVLHGLNLIGYVGASWSLVCYFENDTLKYHSPEFTTCFPYGYLNDLPINLKPEDQIKTRCHNQQLIFDFSGIDTRDAFLSIYNLNGAKVYSAMLSGESSLTIQGTIMDEVIYIYRFKNKDVVLTDKVLIKP